MNSVYYAVIAFILLFPWTILAVMIVGEVLARWVCRAGSAPSRDRADTRITPLGLSLVKFWR